MDISNDLMNMYTSNETLTEYPINENLKSLENTFYISYKGLQTRHLYWGANREGQCLEISRVKADIPPEKGGPMTVTYIRIYDTGIAEFCVTGDILETFVSFITTTNRTVIVTDEIEKCMSKLSDQYLGLWGN